MSFWWQLSTNLWRFGSCSFSVQCSAIQATAKELFLVWMYIEYLCALGRGGFQTFAYEPELVFPCTNGNFSFVSGVAVPWKAITSESYSALILVGKQNGLLWFLMGTDEWKSRHNLPTPGGNLRLQHFCRCRPWIIGTPKSRKVGTTFSLLVALAPPAFYRFGSWPIGILEKRFDVMISCQGTTEKLPICIYIYIYIYIYMRFEKNVHCILY